MLSWAITFLIIAIVAAVLGFGGIAGAATGIAKILFIVFLPLLAALIAGLGNRIIGNVPAKLVTTVGLFISCALSWPIFLGFVGGSGTGKSVLTRTILGLVRKQRAMDAHVNLPRGGVPVMKLSRRYGNVLGGATCLSRSGEDSDASADGLLRPLGRAGGRRNGSVRTSVRAPGCAVLRPQTRPR